MDVLSDLHATHLLSPFSMNCVTFWIVAATMEATLFEGILKNTTISWRKIRNERIYLLCSVISVLFYPRRNLTLLCVGLMSDCWTRKRLDKDNWFVEITTRDRCILLGHSYSGLGITTHGISLSKRRLIHSENGILMAQVAWELLSLPTGSQATDAGGHVGFPAKHFREQNERFIPKTG